MLAQSFADSGQLWLRRLRLTLECGWSRNGSDELVDDVDFDYDLLSASTILVLFLEVVRAAAALGISI